MPVKAPKVCAHCGRVHPVGDTCSAVERLTKERQARFDRTRPNSSQRGYDREFEQAAKAYLAEPGHDKCRCGAPATLVAHIRSIRKAPHLRMERLNWRPSCIRCNAVDAARERHKSTRIF